MKFSVDKASKRVSFSILPVDMPFHSLVRVTGPFGAISRVFNYSSAGMVAKEKFGALKSSLRHLLSDYNGLLRLYRQRLTLHGVGYKSYAPRLFSRSAFVLRVGFGAAEMKYAYDNFIKGRARKQKLILLSSMYERLRRAASEVVQLKRADPYKGKGIRFLGGTFRQKQGKVRSR